MENLPIDPKSLAQGLSQAQQRLPASADVQFIKLTRSGEWVFGADDNEVEDGEWAVNPQSFVEGFIAWGDGELLGEEMAPMAGTPILQSDLEAVEGGKWAKQVGFVMQCVSGEYEGVTALYKTSSKGGTKAVRAMVEQVVKAITNGDEIVPIVSLKASHYKHKQYGKIYTPEFKIDRWITMSATSAVEELDEDELPIEDFEKEPAKKRRRLAT